MAHSKIEDLYYRFINGFIEDLKSDEFYEYFTNMVKSGSNNIMLNEKYVERNIDIRWVEAIEDTIIPLDNIIRTPNRFIKNIEEVVNIEMARTISTESVRHLATHTNFIAQVKGDEVIPSKILNVIKEESFETYENRFIFTLLFKLEYFLDKRMQVLMENNKVADRYEMRIDGSCTAGHDEISYDFSMNYATPHVELTSEELQVGADVSNLTSMQRIERLRKILYSFKGSALIKSLAHCAMVRPPLTMTNVLTKNPNFRKCVDLWRFIERYEDIGYSVNVVERLTNPSEQHVNDMFSLLTLQYVVMKKNTQHTDELGDYRERKNGMEPNVVKKSIEDLLENYDLDINEIRRIFTDQLEKKRKKIKAEFTKINDIIKRAIAIDKDYLAEYNENRKKRESKENVRLKAELAAKAQEEFAKQELIEKERLQSEERHSELMNELATAQIEQQQDTESLHGEKEEAREENTSEAIDNFSIVNQSTKGQEVIEESPFKQLEIDWNGYEQNKEQKELAEQSDLVEESVQTAEEQASITDEDVENAPEQSIESKVEQDEDDKEVCPEEDLTGTIEEIVKQDDNDIEEQIQDQSEEVDTNKQIKKENKFSTVIKKATSATKSAFSTAMRGVGNLFKSKKKEDKKVKNPQEQSNQQQDHKELNDK